MFTTGTNNTAVTVDTETNLPGSITCADGTTADSLEECPQLVDYQADVGYEAEGEFITDDPTTDVDESMQEI